MDKPENMAPVADEQAIEEQLEQFHQEAERGSPANLVTDMRDLLALSF